MPIATPSSNLEKSVSPMMTLPFEFIHGDPLPGVKLQDGRRDESEDMEKASIHEESEEVDGGYGWVVVFATFLLLFSSFGLNSSFGVFFATYLEQGTFEGGTRLEYAFVGGLFFGLGLVFSPGINYLQGVIGTHRTLILGNLFQVAGLLLASFSAKLWQLYLTQGLLQSIGMALIGLPSLTLVSQWFTKRRVLANLIATAGSGAGGIVFNVGTQAILDARGTRWALRAQAIITASFVSIATALVRTRSRHHKIVFTLLDRDCLHCTAYWLFCFCLVTCMFGYVVVLYSVSDFTISLGFSAYKGSIASAMIQVGFTVGRPLIGFLSDIFGPVTITVISYYLSSLFVLAMWIPARSYATVIAFSLLEGLVLSTMFPTAAPTIARLAGIRKLNVFFCMLWVFCGLSSIFAQPIGAKLTSGSSKDPTLYRNTAIFAGCTLFTCATTGLLIRGYIIAKDKIMEREGLIKSSEPLQITVPPGEVLRNCLLWPLKTA